MRYEQGKRRSRRRRTLCGRERYGGEDGEEGKQTDLEDVESFELDVSALVPKQIHHHLEVGLVRDVASHDGVVGPVEEDFSKEFDGLSFRDVVGGEDESGVGGEELF